MIKRAIRSRGGNMFFGWMIAAVIGLLMTSIRWSRRDRREVEAALARHDGAILVFWHERLLAMPYLLPTRPPLYALQSPHADGRMMSHCIRMFGVRTVWGSSNRSALSGLRGLLRVLRGGAFIAITPDGPRGPARRAADGAVALARLSGRPILPLAWSADRVWRGSGWDRMLIPKPFARGRLVVGAPILVDSGPRDDLETHRRRLDAALTALGEQADALFRPRTKPQEDDDASPTGPS